MPHAHANNRERLEKNTLPSLALPNPGPTNENHKKKKKKTNQKTEKNKALCPPLTCAPPPTDLVCPQYIKVSSTTVPCATDCCPTTGTTTVEAGTGSRTGAGSDNCPTCDPCRIPTEWITYTTGCPGGGVRVSTSYSTPTGPS